MIGTPVFERRPRTAVAEQAAGHEVQPPTADRSGSMALKSDTAESDKPAPAARPARRWCMFGKASARASCKKRLAFRPASQR